MMIETSRVAALALTLAVLVPQASSGMQGAPFPLVAEVVFKARAEAVRSGDVVVLRRDGEELLVRLVRIDAPEVSQPFGDLAKEYLSGMVVGREVTVRARDFATSDEVGNARLLVGDTDVGLKLVRAGLAWHCKGRRDDADLAVAERRAREQRRGLWGQEEPEPPWVHRGVEDCLDGA